MNTFDMINLTINPWQLLGISPDANDREIEDAWENLSNAHRKNDTIRQAYQLIATEQSRAHFRLLSPHQADDPLEMVEKVPPKPVYSGPGIWYKTLSNQLKAQSEE